MAEKPETNSGLEGADDTIFNSDIGDDWGDAFQAEDFMFSPDEEASAEFFLEDDSFASEESEGIGPGGSPGDTDLFGDLDGPKSLTGLSTLTNLVAFFLHLPKTITIPAVGLVIALAAVLLFFWPEPSPPPPELTKLPGTNQGLPASESTASTSQTTPGQETSLGQTALPTPPVTSQVPPPLPVEKVRKRWKLPSFFISTFNEKENATALLSIDLTFVLLLEKETVIPDDSELLVRETIFQFFNNRPYAELKRFALSRGEMTRGLTSWINKQLPEIPLSSIVFDRYQIL